MTEPHFERVAQAEGPPLSLVIYPSGRMQARLTAQWRDVDEVLELVIELVRVGDVAISDQRPSGEFVFRITEQGMRRAEIYLGSGDKAALFFRTLLRHDPERVSLSLAEQRVLSLLSDEQSPIEVLMERSELTKGQVLHALAVLNTLGLTGDD